MSNEIVRSEMPKTDMERVRRYILSPEVKERFSDMMGTNGIYYLNQVLILVANNPKLQECSPQSILISAMRAASLKLSVDPARGEAWIIPYKGKATFQLGYRGIYELALRTNQYRHINVIDIYEGFELRENILTGDYEIVKTERTGKIVGFMLYFKLFNGFEKTFYMTVEEIESHAQRYSQSYTYSDSPWNRSDDDRRKMMRKTVLSNGLRKWGRFNDGDVDILADIEEHREWHDPLPDESDVTVVEEPAMTSEDRVSRLMGSKANEDDTNTRTRKTKKEPEPVNTPNPYQSFIDCAKDDPATAFWSLAKHIGMDVNTAQAIIKEMGNNMEAAFQALLKQAPPMLV